ncbi:hypothetical protein POM88_017651 [Heracleum sosnowskyi]|uniref:Transposase MuDR plant domain-containing protein n=1 Tax=Heracleum sosnowskyi TaxID=360622 RepID=A0AAD8IR47_9APIA|nr:hypothetical protein POM88_017651 [Heracleum sosnowskyi]
MSSPATPVYAFGWLFIDGTIVQNDVEGYAYDRQMCRLIKLDVTLNYKQLSQIIAARLKIDTNLYRLKIMHRCFNPLTKMFAVAPVLDDDDVALMFELVLSSGVKNSVVELYLEKVLIHNALVEKMSVDVGLGALNSSTVQTVVVPRQVEKVLVSRDLEKGGENVEVSDDGEESGGSNKKTPCKQGVFRKGKMPSGKNQGEDSGSPFFRSFDGSCRVATPKEPIFTMIGDVLHVTDLKKGMVFATREELSEIVYQVHSRDHLEVKGVRKNSCRWSVQCKRRADGCIWSLRATKRKRHGFFEIMKIWGAHTCMNQIITEDNANLTNCSIIEAPNVQVSVDPFV